MDPVIATYEATHPNVKINYTMESPQNYRSRVQSAVSQGNSPDIIRIHNTWLPEMQSILSPAPDSVMTVGGLSAYYPVVQKNAVYGGKVYALPLEVDGLALFYNQDMLSAAGATPPTDWNSLRKLAFSLTKRDTTTGIITQSGAALGTTGNVEHWSDILGLLILQNSGNPGEPSSTAVQDALTFYTIFTTQDKTWDASQPNSIYAFATGTVAMILAPSWEAAQIKAINPNLKFAVAPAPTLPSTNVAWASYWMEGVPSGSKNPTEAWNFIKYLSSTDALQKLYTGESQIRGIGEPYPLTSMSGLLANDPLAGPFVSQGPSYTSWYMSSRTYDQGLNDQIIKYYDSSIFSAKAKIELGLLELNRKSFENADMFFKELGEKRTDDIGAQAQYYYGVSLFEQNKMTDAITALVRVRSVFSGFDEWYTKSLLKLGDCYVELRDKKQAREMYRAVIERHKTGELTQEAKRKLNKL